MYDSRFLRECAAIFSDDTVWSEGYERFLGDRPIPAERNESLELSRWTSMVQSLPMINANGMLESEEKKLTR